MRALFFVAVAVIWGVWFYIGLATWAPPVRAHACVAFCTDAHRQDSHDSSTQNCSAAFSCPSLQFGGTTSGR